MDAAHAGLRRSAVVVLAVLGSLLATLAPTGPALADPAPAVAAAAPAGTSLAVTVAMVQPGGAPRDARTLQQVVDTLTGPVAAYWQQQSGGHLRIGIEAAHDWTSTTATCADLTSLVGEVSRGVDWNPGRRDGESLLVYVPETAPDCPRGWAEPATSEHRWSNRAVLVVRDATPSSLAAQLGRSFGLGSSDALRCDGSVEGSVEGTVAGTGDAAGCDVVPEGDPYDLLGAAGVELGSLNAAHADRIQLLPAGQRRTVRVVDPVGTHRLSPISGSSGLRGLELVDRSGDSYWLEYRPAAGRDGWLAGPGNTRGVTAGVQVRLMARDDDTSLLLDGTPGPAAGRDADVSTALPSGTAVGLAGGDFTVRVSSVSAGSAEVVVSPAQGSRALSAAYEAQRQQGSLGEPTGPERCGLRAGGCSRVYASGTVAWSPATGAWAMDRDTGRRWRAAGAENGPLGYPLAEPDCDLPSSQGCRQAFQGGVVFASSYGTWPVWGAIRKKWEALGADGGPAGAPVSGEVCGLGGGGCYQ